MSPQTKPFYVYEATITVTYKDGTIEVASGGIQITDKPIT